MKVRINKVTIPIGADLSLTGKTDFDYYTLEYKFHWWQKYKFVLDRQTHVPRLFKTMYEINSFLYSVGFEEVLIK